VSAMERSRTSSGEGILLRLERGITWSPCDFLMLPDELGERLGTLLMVEMEIMGLYSRSAGGLSVKQVVAKGYEWCEHGAETDRTPSSTHDLSRAVDNIRVALAASWIEQCLEVGSCTLCPYPRSSVRVLTLTALYRWRLGW